MTGLDQGDRRDGERGTHLEWIESIGLADKTEWIRGGWKKGHY